MCFCNLFLWTLIIDPGVCHCPSTRLMTMKCNGQTAQYEMGSKVRIIFYHSLLDIADINMTLSVQGSLSDESTKIMLFEYWDMIIYVVFRNYELSSTSNPATVPLWYINPRINPRLSRDNLQGFLWHHPFNWIIISWLKDSCRDTNRCSHMTIVDIRVVTDDSLYCQGSIKIIHLINLEWSTAVNNQKTLLPSPSEYVTRENC